MNETIIEEVKELVDSSPLRSGVAGWYQGAESVVNLKDEDGEVLDLVCFDQSDEDDSFFMKEYQVYRIFSLGGKSNISVDNTFLTPPTSDRKDLDKLSLGFVKFIKDLFDKHMTR